MNRKLRSATIQAAFMAALIFIVVGFLTNAKTNLANQGITSGFGFLARGTGWNMGFSFLPVSITDPYWWTLLMGLTNTVVVGYVAMALATFLGVGLAAMRISGNPVLGSLALIYIDIIRNVPPILQVLAWYALFSALPSPRQAIDVGGVVFLTARGIFVPAVNITPLGATFCALIVIVAIGLLLWIGLGKRFMFTPARTKWRLAAMVGTGTAAAIVLTMILTRIPETPLWSVPSLQGFNFRGGASLPPELTTILVATMVYGSAYIAEIVRGGFNSVDPGKIEAGRALGMNGWMIFSRIHLPITIRNIIPMMTNLYVWLIKATTLGIAVGFSDLFAVTVSSINQSGQTIEFILILAGAFWLLNSVVTWIMNGINTRLQRGGLR